MIVYLFLSKIINDIDIRHDSVSKFFFLKNKVNEWKPIFHCQDYFNDDFFYHFNGIDWYLFSFSLKKWFIESDIGDFVLLSPNSKYARFDNFSKKVFEFSNLNNTWVSSEKNILDYPVCTNTYYSESENVWYNFNEISGKFIKLNEKNEINPFFRFDYFKKVLFEYDPVLEDWFEVFDKNYVYTDNTTKYFFDRDYSKWFIFSIDKNSFEPVDYHPKNFNYLEKLLENSRFDFEKNLIYIFDLETLSWRAATGLDIEKLKNRVLRDKKLKFFKNEWLFFDHLDSCWKTYRYFPNYWYPDGYFIDLSSMENYRLDANSGRVFFYSEVENSWEDNYIEKKPIIYSDNYFLYDQDLSCWFKKKKNSNFENVGWIPKKLDLFDDSDLLYKFFRKDSFSGNFFYFDVVNLRWVGQDSDFNLKYSINKDENTFWFFDKFNDIWYKSTESFFEKNNTYFRFNCFSLGWNFRYNILENIWYEYDPITGLWEKTLKNPKYLSNSNIYMLNKKTGIWFYKTTDFDTWKEEAKYNYSLGIFTKINKLVQFYKISNFFKSTGISYLEINLKKKNNSFNFEIIKIWLYLQLNLKKNLNEIKKISILFNFFEKKNYKNYKYFLKNLNFYKTYKFYFYYKRNYFFKKNLIKYFKYFVNFGSKFFYKKKYKLFEKKTIINYSNIEYNYLHFYLKKNISIKNKINKHKFGLNNPFNFFINISDNHLKNNFKYNTLEFKNIFNFYLDNNLKLKKKNNTDHYVTFTIKDNSNNNFYKINSNYKIKTLSYIFNKKK